MSQIRESAFVRPYSPPIPENYQLLPQPEPLQFEGAAYSAKVEDPLGAPPIHDGASGSSIFSGLWPNVGWRPATIKFPVLVAFAMLTIAFIAAAEYILRQSQSHGAVTFVSGAAIDAAIGYIPLVCGVLLGLLWASVDHDIKRLEPYFQLSKPGGVTAEHSLLLEYPYIFAGFAPFVALRKRHWTVMCSASIFILIFYGVTPLMSTILSKETIERTENFGFSRAGLIPVDQQFDQLTTAFSYIAYCHEYLGGSMPGFTTPDYAILPLKPVANLTTHPGETWIVRSTLYEGHLECSAGVIKRVSSKTVDRTQLSNGRDCYFDYPDFGPASYYSPYTSFFINHKIFSPSNGGLLLDVQIECPRPDLFVGFWGRRAGVDEGRVYEFANYSNASVIFCTPKHVQQEVDVTVDAGSFEILDVHRIPGSQREFSGLNLTYWQDLLVGYETSPSTAEFNVSGRYRDRSTQASWNNVAGSSPGFFRWGFPEHASRLSKNPAFRTLMESYAMPPGGFNIGQLLSYIPSINTYLANPRSLAPFGLDRQKDLEDLLDPQKLFEMYNEQYRKMFAIAMTSGLSTFNGSVPADATGRRMFKTSAYVAKLVWIRVLEAVLSVVLALNVVLILLLHFRRCDLISDPGSLASAMASADRSVLEGFADVEFMSPKELNALFRTRKELYALKEQKVIVVGDSLQQPIYVDRDRSHVTLSKPWEITLSAGLVALILLLAWVILLGVLYTRSNETPLGFKVPGNEFSYQLYASYLPTIAATLFESLLVLLASHVMLLFPFKQLQLGYKSAAQTLSVNYDKKPPHLMIFRALSSRNWLLVLLSASILLANVLAVAMGALFFKGSVEYAEPVQVIFKGAMDSLDRLNASSLVGTVHDLDTEFFYAAQKFFATRDVDKLEFRRRPWTTDELYYIPFSDPNGTLTNASNYTVEAVWGFGMKIACEEIPASGLKEWHSRTGNYSLDTGLIATNNTFAFITLADDHNMAMIQQYSKVQQRRLKNDTQDPELLTDLSRVFNVDFFESPDSVAYFRLQEQYSENLTSHKPSDFLAAWTKYLVDNRTVTIDRNVVWRTKSLSETIWGPSAYVASQSIITCKPRPRIVKSRVTSDLDGKIVRTENTEEISSYAMAFNDTGVLGLVNGFQQIMLRIHRATYYYDHGNRLDPRPNDWLELLVHQHARESNPEFSLFTFPQEACRAMEAVYTRLFGIYLQLHEDRFFTAADASKRPVGSGTVMRHHVRVLMKPTSFWITVALMSVFIPAVVWTYLNLYRAFLCHVPMSLAGTYAAFYCSSALLEVEGTEMMRSKARAELLERLGQRYGYGWFVGSDGERHVGIEKEPLLAHLE